MSSFKSIGLQEDILHAIEDLGFQTPTPIQAEAIPHLLSSTQDVIATAQTGTGKTAAFGLPAIQLTDLSQKNTQTLILCPTRELCLQITQDLTRFATYIRGLYVVAVYGGANIDKQIKELQRGAHIVVATPGRARDLLKRNKLKLDSISRLVLDEADEMLTMGFKEELDAILGQTPKEKQTLLFSATMSREIISITKKYMHDPVNLSVAKVNMGSENVSHTYYMVKARDKYSLLKRLADMNPNIYGIVFCQTRRETKEVAHKLIHDGYNAGALHGDLSQAQRDEVMDRFRIKQLQVLVATDVASRGLDVNDLTHVINFSLPDSEEVYVHRSGRTGRAGKKGISVAIINTRQKGQIRDIERHASIKFNEGTPPTSKEICTEQLYTLIDKIEKVEVDEEQIAPFLPVIYQKFESLDRETLIKHFVSAEFNHFLSYYKNMSDLENVGHGDDDQDRRRGRRGDLARLHINVGAKQKLNPARLIGLVNEALNSREAAIGKIEILTNFSFFEVDQSKVNTLIAALSGEYFEGNTLAVEKAASSEGGRDGGKRKFGKKKESFDSKPRFKEGASKQRRRRTK